MVRNRRPIFKLDQEEQALSDSIDRGEWVPVDDLEEAIGTAKGAAANFLRKGARVNIRLSESDLKRLKQIAAFEGLPYQTLISSVLHKYAAGHFSTRSG